MYREISFNNSELSQSISYTPTDDNYYNSFPSISSSNTPSNNNLNNLNNLNNTSSISISNTLSSSLNLSNNNNNNNDNNNNDNSSDNSCCYISSNKKRSRPISYREEYDSNNNSNYLPPIATITNSINSTNTTNTKSSNLLFSSQDSVMNNLDNSTYHEESEIKSNLHLNKHFQEPIPLQNFHNRAYNQYNNDNQNNPNKLQKTIDTPNVIQSVLNHFLPQPALKISKTTIWLNSNEEKPRFRWDFVDIQDLGRGAHSSVYVARHRLDGSLYAIKKLNSYIDDKQPTFNDVKEVCANVALKGCPNLVQYFGSWIEDNHLWLQLELCLRVNLDIFVISDSVPIPSLSRPNSSSMSFPSINDNDNNDNDNDNLSDIDDGDDDKNKDINYQEKYGKNEFKSTPQKYQQQHQVNNQKCLLSEKTFWKILYSISKALEFIHSKSLAHLDIRPANIFITSTLIPEKSTSNSLKRMASIPISSTPSGLHTPRFKIPSITRNGSFKTQQSFTSVFGPSNFPPPCKLEKKISDCESLLCGMTQKSDFNDEILIYSSQTGTTHDLSFQGSIIEELPPLEMSQPESIFEENRHKSYDNINAQDVDENISNGNWDIKLGDLGLCCRLDDYGFNEGEDRYCASELIQRSTPEIDLTKADIFSLGASLLEMCLGRKLCSSGEEWQTIRNGGFEKILESYEKNESNIPFIENQPSFIELMNYSKEIRNILKQMLHHDPIYRPNATLLKVLASSNVGISTMTEEERDHHLTVLSLSDKIRELEKKIDILKSQKK